MTTTEPPLADVLEEEVARHRGRPLMPGPLARACHDLCAEGRDLGLPRVSPRPLAQARYVALRLDGQGHALAEMLALQAPPMSNSDREFLEGHCNGSQFQDTPHFGDVYKRLAEARGADVTGKVYLSGLAAFPGDPEAWVSGRGDVERVLDARGWGSEGAVSRKVSKVGEPLGLAVGEDLVQEEVRALVAEDPGRARDLEGVRERVVNLRKPHWSK